MSTGPVAFSEAELQRVRELQALYPDRRAALLPVLRMAQERFGHVSLEVEAYVAGLFDLSRAHVHEVVTFYTLFFRQPVGRHVVSVCHNLSCTLGGAEDLIAHLEARLGIEAGETTPDGRVTLLRVECLCACELAPMMQVDEDYVGPLTRERLDHVLGELR
ncbi:MAG: NADH-quinone oxidoreductase subunit NuoE [Candidatus Rokubacteria bacterium]|nr:NADH-quinone oxidoreductase subunit NuoE [Candidatus Rokubacteria bacterium]